MTSCTAFTDIQRFPEKERNRFESLTVIPGALTAKAVFFAFAVVRLLWTAVAGGFGLLVFPGFASLSTCYLPPTPLHSGQWLKLQAKEHAATHTNQTQKPGFSPEAVVTTETTGTAGSTGSAETMWLVCYARIQIDIFTNLD